MSDLLDGLRRACTVVKAGQASSILQLSQQLESLSSSEQRTIFQAVKDAWHSTSCDTSTSSTSSFSLGCPPALGSASELLRVLLCMPGLCLEAMTACIECIQSGVISGRSAIFCISEVRLAVTTKRASTNTTSHFRDGDSSGDDCNAAGLEELVGVCLRPYLTPLEEPPREAIACLDLLPALVGTWYNDPSSSSSSSSSMVALDHLLSSAWHASAHLPLLNALAELYMHLNRSQLHIIQVRLLNAVPVLKNGRAVDKADFSGAMRVCLRLLEHSGDAGWAHIFRIYYANVPASEVLNVEGLLEQLLLQSPAVGRVLASVVEDAAVYVTKVVVGGSYSSKITEAGNIDCYNDIPEIGVSDARLLIVVAHSSGSSLSQQANIPLPSLLGGLEGGSLDHLRLSRALCVTLLCVALLAVHRGRSSSAPNGHSSSSSVPLTAAATRALPLSLRLSSAMSHIIQATIVSTDSSSHTGGPSWLRSMRGTELVAMVLKMVCSEEGGEMASFLATFDVDAVTGALVLRRDDSVPLGAHRVYSTAVSRDIIAALYVESAVSVFDGVASCRAPILLLIGRALTACVSRELLAGSLLGTGQRGTGLSESQRGREKVLDRAAAACKVFVLKLLDVLCDRHASTHFNDLHGTIQSLLSMLSLLPARELSALLPPLNALAAHSSIACGHVLSSYRKFLGQQDMPRKCLALRGLVMLLQTVQNVATQAEMVRTLLHSLGMALVCRRAVYSHLSHALSISNISAQDSSAGLAAPLLRSLRERVCRQLTELFVFSTEECFASFCSSSGASSTAKNELFCVLYPSRCVENFRSSRGVSAVLKEDVRGLLQLCWALELSSDRLSTQRFLEKVCRCLCACSFNELEGAVESSAVAQLGGGYLRLTAEQAIVQLLLTSLSRCCPHDAEDSMPRDLLLGVVNFIALGLPDGGGSAGLCLCRSAVAGLATCIQMTIQSYGSAVPAPHCMPRALIAVQSIVTLLLDITVESAGSADIRGHSSFADAAIASLTGVDASSGDAREHSSVAAIASIEDMQSALHVIAESFKLRKATGGPAVSEGSMSVSGGTDNGSNIALFIARLPMSSALGYTSHLCHEASLTPSGASSDKEAVRQLLALLAALGAAYTEVGAVGIAEDSLLALAVACPLVLQVEGAPRKRRRRGDDSEEEEEEEEEDGAAAAAGAASDAGAGSLDGGSGIGRFRYIEVAQQRSLESRRAHDEQLTPSRIFGALGPAPGTPALLQSLFETISPTARAALKRWDIPQLEGALHNLSRGRLRGAVRDSARHMLFSLRNEVLWAASAIFRSIDYRRLPISVDTRLEYGLFWCEELSAAISEGVTVRTVKAFVQLLGDIAFSANESAALLGDFVVAPCASAEKMLTLLRHIAFSIDSSQSQLVNAVLRLLLVYGGRAGGLAECCRGAREVLATASTENVGDTSNNSESDGDSYDGNNNAAAGSRHLLIEKGRLETVLHESLKVIGSSACWQTDSRSSSAASLAASQLFLRGDGSAYDFCDASGREIVRETAGSVCDAIFAFFENSTYSSSDDTGDREGKCDISEGVGSQSRLELVSERIRRKVLSLSLRYVRRCVVEATKVTAYCASLHRKSNRLKRQLSLAAAQGEQDGDSLNGATTQSTDGSSTQENSALPVSAETESQSSTFDCHFLCSLLQRVRCETILSMREWIRRLPDTSAGLSGGRKSYSYIAASPSDKLAHAVAFKIEELEWKLVSAFKEIDGLKQVYGGKLGASALPAFFIENIVVIDSCGRSTVTHLQRQAGRRGSNTGDSIGDGDSDSNNNDDDEYDSVRGDSDGMSDEEVGLGPMRRKKHLLSRSTSASIMRTASAGSNDGRRMRSRNRVINEWLGEERSNDDAYADLEDFIE